MRRLSIAALLALLVLCYAMLLMGCLTGQLGLVVFVAIVAYGCDTALSQVEDIRFLPSLRQVGADPLWRTFYRTSLIAIFVVRSGRLSHSDIALVVIGVFGRQLALALRNGLVLVIQRRRMRRIETTHLDVPGSRLPSSLPEWIGGALGAQLQLLSELFLLGGLVWTFASSSYRPLVLGAVLMLLASLVFPAAMLGQLRAVLRLPSDEERIEAAQAAVLALRPTVILYFSGGLNAVYQVNMWFETLERLNRSALVLVRERRYLDKLPESRVPVLCMPYTSDLMNFDFTGAKVALYVANVGRNIHFLRVPTLKSAFIGHGDSDKVASFNPYSKVYDEVWVAGAAGRDRYIRAQVGVRPEEIVIVGRPQLDGIAESGARHPDAPFTVLYAPTWEGWTDEPHASSLLEMGRELVRVLLDATGVRVLFKAHPLSGTVQHEFALAQQQICAMLAAAGAEHRAILDDEPTLYECFDESDALISDISSVVSDYLRSEKPYFVTNGADQEDASFRREYPSAGAAYLVGAGAAGLREGLSAARGGDPMRARRRVTREYLLGDPKIEAIVRFRQAVDDLAEKGPSSHMRIVHADDDIRLQEREKEEFPTIVADGTNASPAGQR